MLVPDQLLKDRYLVTRPVGLGVMGALYEAVDRNLDVRVAVKETLIPTEALRETVEAESLQMAKLRNPFLPSVVDSFVEGERHYLVSHFVAGECLAERLERSGAQPPAHVLRWADTLLDALDAMHSLRPPLCHSDVSAGNALLTSRSDLMLVDFGPGKRYLSARLGSRTRYSSARMFDHLLPIEGLDRDLDPRSDIYALSATLYHLFTGKPPDSAIDRRQVLRAGQGDITEHMGNLVPGLRSGVADLVMAGLALEPNDRPSSAGAMRESLAAATRTTLHVQSPPAPARREPPPVVTAPGLRFQAIRPIGKGGIGKTYLAVDTRSGDLVCLKALDSSVREHALVREVEALARLDHPNVVKVVDFDPALPAPHIAMEYIDGPTLAQYVRAHVPLAGPVAVALARGILEGLECVHERSIIHRNLEPNNVLLAFTGVEIVPKILDFGLLVGNACRAQMYLAPEQYDGADASEACDLYAVGVMLWEMLVGEVPFNGGQGDMLRQKEALSDGLDLRQAVAGVPEALARLVASCTRSDPRRRPTAEASLAMLTDLIQLGSPPAVVAPVNGTFRLKSSAGYSGWFNGSGLVSGVSLNYAISHQPPTWCNGTCVLLEATNAATDDDFGTVTQTFPAWHLVGRQLRFEGALQAEDVSGWAGLWLRIDGPRGRLFFDNMHDRSIRGTTSWSACAIDAVVPSGAERIAYGVVLAGRGSVKATSLRIACDAGSGLQPLELWNEIGYQADESSSTRDDTSVRNQPGLSLDDAALARRASIGVDDQRWMEYIDREVRAVCDERGWGHQIRRTSTVREKPVCESRIEDYEWKLLPDKLGRLPDIDEDFDEGHYYILRIDRPNNRIVFQHSTEHFGAITPEWERATYTDIELNPISWWASEQLAGFAPGHGNPPIGWLCDHISDLVRQYSPNFFKCT